MAFESVINDQRIVSPGGFEFGVQGWVWADPIVKSITFFIDNTASVCDHYGRQVLRSISASGSEVRFAPTGPPMDRNGNIISLRPQFATHQQVIKALLDENIDIIAEINKAGNTCPKCNGTGKLSGNQACKTCFHKDSGRCTGLLPCISSVGWPQIPYDQLKKLKELPPTPIEWLEKIKDPALRRDALRIRREVDEVREKELQATVEE